MRTTTIILSVCTTLILFSPFAVHAFWGSGGEKQSGLNLETGYDANTVTTMNGSIVSVMSGDNQRNAQFELESSGVRVLVLLGPQGYWAEKGIPLKVGDNVSVRGSKAQGKDGIVYILAQKISDISQNSTISLRNDSGRPVWAGNGAGNGMGRMNRSTQSPGRMGGGRMGR
jgi:hypothetical protein